MIPLAASSRCHASTLRSASRVRTASGWVRRHRRVGPDDDPSWCAGPCRSISTTWCPRRASSAAAGSPQAPAPTTTHRTAGTLPGRMGAWSICRSRARTPPQHPMPVSGRRTRPTPTTSPRCSSPRGGSATPTCCPRTRSHASSAAAHRCALVRVDRAPADAAPSCARRHRGAPRRRATPRSPLPTDDPACGEVVAPRGAPGRHPARARLAPALRRGRAPAPRRQPPRCGCGAAPPTRRGAAFLASAGLAEDGVGRRLDMGEGTPGVEEVRLSARLD